MLNELISIGVQLVGQLVQGGGDRLGVSSLDIVSECLPVELAAALPKSTGKIIGTLKEIIRNRYRRFHTQSITAILGVAGQADREEMLPP